MGDSKGKDIVRKLLVARSPADQMSLKLRGAQSSPSRPSLVLWKPSYAEPCCNQVKGRAAAAIYEGLTFGKRMRCKSQDVIGGLKRRRDSALVMLAEGKSEGGGARPRGI